MIPMPRVRASKISLPTSDVLEVVAAVEDALHRVAAVGDPAPRQVVLDPADAVEVRVEAAAGRGLDEVEHVLAVAEAPERGRERADLEAHLAEEQVGTSRSARAR